MGSDVKLCCKCNKAIHPDRLEAVPDTTTCVGCSDVKKVKGLMDYGHKTAGAIVMLPDDPEQQRMAFRQYRRAR